MPTITVKARIKQRGRDGKIKTVTKTYAKWNNRYKNPVSPETPLIEMQEALAFAQARLLEETTFEIRSTG